MITREKLMHHLMADGLPAFSMALLAYGAWGTWPSALAAISLVFLGAWLAAYLIMRFAWPHLVRSMWKEFSELRQFLPQDLADEMAKIIEQRLRNDGYDVTITTTQPPQRLN